MQQIYRLNPMPKHIFRTHAYFQNIFYQERFWEAAFLFTNYPA